MYGKFVVLLAFAALALAREYPAGLNPALCPNYPDCDPTILARYTPEGIPIPEWGFPSFGYYRALVAPAMAPVLPEVPTTEPAPIIEAPKYPADFDSSKCPNYPTCL